MIDDMINNQLVKAHDKLFKPMIAAQTILERVEVIGQQISNDYSGKKPLLLTILNGAYMFAADLSRAIHTDLELTFVKLSSYKGTTTTGNVTTVLGLDTILSGRHIIIVEDIVDTGNTLHKFLKELEKENPASVEIAACFLKPTALQHPLSIKYLGFEIPDHFIIGYGLDYDGLGRNLADIYELNE